MRVTGIINPTGVTPSFVIPLFGDLEELYIQRTDGYEKITSFERVYVSNEAKDNILWLDAGLHGQVEDQRLYGFQFEKNNCIVGTRSELGRTLVERLTELKKSDRPFLLMDVAEFLGNASLRSSARSSAYALLNRASPSAATRWQDIMDAESINVTQPTPVMADPPPNKNSLSKDIEIKGSIKFANEFFFDGNLEGEVSSVDGVLTIGENADVRAEIKSKTVIVKGKVHGHITVEERCELHARSQLIGDLKAARLVIEEGATFVGKAEVTPSKNIIKDLGAPPHKEEPQKVGAPR